MSLRNTIYNKSSKEDLILSKNINKNIFVFELGTNLTPQLTEDGVLTFKDNKNQNVFQLPKPYMYDSNIDPKSGESAFSDKVEYAVERKGSRWILNIIADETWLKSEERVYPIYLDPTVNFNTSAADGDTFISSAYPTTNYENFRESSGYYSLKVGFYDGFTGTNFAYVKQDLSSLSYVEVESATFNIYTAHSYSSSPTRVWLDEVNYGWDATSLTWNKAKDKLTSWNIAHDDVKKGDWARFNVTDTVKKWIGIPPTKSNYGFALHTNGKGKDYWKKFYASENSQNKPYLAVTYKVTKPKAPSVTANANWVGSESGFIDLKWEPVPAATGYYVWIYNGKEYQKFDVGKVTNWSTYNKGIWPTKSEIDSGQYKLHTDGKGAELARDPSPVYNNSGGSYANTGRKNYAIRISAKYPVGETQYSDAVVPVIPERSEDLGTTDFWTFINVPGGVVNAVTGNFVLHASDTGLDGRGLPIPIMRTYNSRSKEKGLFGDGWHFNFSMHVKEDDKGNIILTDDDGTSHQFSKNSDGTYAKPLGLYTTIQKENNGFVMTDKDKSKFFFDATGKLLKAVDADSNTNEIEYNSANQITTIKDASGRKFLFTYNKDGYVETMKDPANHMWSYGYDGDKLTSVTNPENGLLRYEYTNDVLTKVIDKNSTTEKSSFMAFTYADDRLISVINNEGNQTKIQYDVNVRKAVVTDPKGNQQEVSYNISANPEKIVIDPAGLNLIKTYKYDHNNLIEFKDAKANQSGSTKPTNSYKYDLNGNRIESTDHNGTKKYQYVDDQLVKYTDAKGKVYTFTYDGTKKVSSIDPEKLSGGNTYDSFGNIISSTKQLGIAHNILNNGGMEITDDVFTTFPEYYSNAGSNDTGYIALDQNVILTGNQSIRIAPKSNASVHGYKAATQDIPVKPNTTYTLSGHIKTSSLQNANAFFNTLQLNSDKGYVASKPWNDNRFNQLKGTNDWTKRQVTFTTGSDAAFVRVYLEVDHTNDSTSGYAWFDDIQLEEGLNTKFNPINNSSFEENTSSWYRSNGEGTIVSSDAFDGGHSLKLARSTKSSNAQQFVQSIDLNQSTPEPITVSGLSKATSVVNGVEKGPNKDYSIWIDAILEDGSYATDQAMFSVGTHDWQRAAVTIKPKKPIKTARVYLLFRGNNTGYALFDNVRLYEESGITSYEYDEKGNYRIKTTDPLGYTAHATYDELGNELTATDPKGNTWSSQYSPLSRLMAATAPGTGLQINYEYDKNGNIISKKHTNKDQSQTYSTANYAYDVMDRLISSTDALGNVTKFEYDGNGNQTKKINADGAITESTFDKADRQQDIRYNGVVQYQFNYDANGNIIGVQDPTASSNTKFTYDDVNRLTKQENEAGSVLWAYDENDNTKEVSLMNQSNTYKQSYQYNDNNLNTQVIDQWTGKVARFDYNESQLLNSYVLGNGVGTDITQDDNDRVTSIGIGNKDGNKIASFSYEYDANGNRTKATSANGSEMTYAYDEQNQLLTETDSKTQQTIRYIYDALGNRTKKNVTDADGQSVSTQTYSYNALNQLIQVDDRPFVFDKNGNLIDDGEKRYSFDPDGNLTTVKKKSDESLIAKYEYDHIGRRVRSIVAGKTTNFVYAGDSIQVLYETDASNNMTRYYTYNDAGMLISMTTKDKASYYYHYNAHGDVIAVTDQESKVVASYEYDAWGNIIKQEGTFADENPIRYAGYRYDSETGFYYLIARYYDPAMGRFLSLDPEPGDDDDPKSQNLYVYTANNPVMFQDPDGNRFVSKGIGSGGGFRGGGGGGGIGPVRVGGSSPRPSVHNMRNPQAERRAWRKSLGKEKKEVNDNHVRSWTDLNRLPKHVQRSYNAIKNNRYRQVSSGIPRVKGPKWGDYNNDPKNIWAEKLPKEKGLTYKEYDVNPPNIGRDGERFVIGFKNNKPVSSYYTNDHYDSFVRFK
ncbi:DNRLRE domain-containing protein [Hazenella sp. IB182357]|uniref:DNRLRE domain-containing protein n=1 Tax=Polycladospora coralii TaxID=2771432 RepID=A0A926N6R6_9BACL|nr:DNRLRE domain-containing protein [Polycladospora coralii]MBD1372701.1 DNRLRE domain-containing protein [Polycladospora coralii]